MKKLRMIAAFLIAPLAAPLAVALAIMVPYQEDLTGIFMLQWIFFVLLTPFSYLTTFSFGILASTLLKDVVLRSKSRILFAATLYGLLASFLFAYSLSFFRKSPSFVFAGGVLGFLVALLFSVIAGFPRREDRTIEENE